MAFRARLRRIDAIAGMVHWQHSSQAPQAADKKYSISFLVEVLPAARATPKALLDEARALVESIQAACPAASLDDAAAGAPLTAKLAQSCEALKAALAALE